VDPLTALIISAAVAVTAKKARDAGGSVLADWNAFREGSTELPSQARKRILAELHAELAKQNKDFQSMSANQQARYLRQIGKQPGVGTLLSTQYRNAAAAANRKLSSYWDEMERRAQDPEYARRIQEEKQQARQKAKAKWERRKTRAKDAGRWVASGTQKANRKAQNGKEAFREWLRGHIPQEPPPDGPTPGSNPGPTPGPTSGPNPGPNPGPNSGSGFGFGKGKRTRNERAQKQRARTQRAQEEKQRRTTIGSITVQEVPNPTQPNPTPPANPPGLTQGPPQLGPSTQEGPAMFRDENDEEDRKDRKDRKDRDKDRSAVATKPKPNTPAGQSNNQPAKKNNNTDTAQRPNTQGSNVAVAGAGAGSVSQVVSHFFAAVSDVREAQAKMHGAVANLEVMGAGGAVMDGGFQIVAQLGAAAQNAADYSTIFAMKAEQIRQATETNRDMPRDIHAYHDD